MATDPAILVTGIVVGVAVVCSIGYAFYSYHGTGEKATSEEIIQSGAAGG